MTQYTTHSPSIHSPVQHFCYLTPVMLAQTSVHCPPTSAIHLWQLWDVRQSYFQRLALRWMNGNQNDMAEAFNQAALAVWQRAPGAGQTVTNPMGWLTGLLRHTCLDLHRTHQREARRLESLEATEEVAALQLAAPSSQSPEHHLLQQEKYAYLHAAIDELPGHLRTPLILHCCHELSSEEIGLKLNLTPANARQRIHLARIALRSKLRAYQAGQAGPETDWPAAQQLFVYKTDSTAPTTMDPHNEPCRPRVTVLDHVSKREQQKLCTLRAYVQRHPSGWKKQLALADQLCKMGQTTEALPVYQQVAVKQPRLLSVLVQIGRLCGGLGRVEEAAAAFTQALALAKSDAQRAEVLALQSALGIEMLGSVIDEKHLLV